MSCKRLLSIAVLSLISVSANAETLQAATSLARSGRASDAAAALQSIVSANPANDGAQSLLCTVLVSMNKYDDGIRACEAAARLVPNSSPYQIGIAKAYGEKATSGGTLTGMRVVGHIRAALEKAAQLDPNSVEALSDLGQFYVEAPSMVGGGTDKAKGLTAHLLQLNPARGHRLLGMIAAKEGDSPTALAEYGKEIAVSHSPESYVDMARFYVHQKDWNNAASYAVQAIQHDAKHGADAVDAANILLSLNRNLDVAEQGYRGYLSLPDHDPSVPAFRVLTWLGQSLAKQGHKDDAKQSYASALALAHDYSPAQKGLNG